jgi:hypothetical protein
MNNIVAIGIRMNGIRFELLAAGLARPRGADTVAYRTPGLTARLKKKFAAKSM